MLNHTNRFKITANIRLDGYVSVLYLDISLHISLFASIIEREKMKQQKHPSHNQPCPVWPKEISIRSHILINLHHTLSLLHVLSNFAFRIFFPTCTILLNHNQRKLDLLKLKIINCAVDRSEFVTVVFFLPLSLTSTPKRDGMKCFQSEWKKCAYMLGICVCVCMWVLVWHLWKF